MVRSHRREENLAALTPSIIFLFNFQSFPGPRQNIIEALQICICLKWHGTAGFEFSSFKSLPLVESRGIAFLSFTVYKIPYQLLLNCDFNKSRGNVFPSTPALLLPASLNVDQNFPSVNFFIFFFIRTELYMLSYGVPGEACCI